VPTRDRFYFACLALGAKLAFADRCSNRSPDEGLSAFTCVFDALWRNPGPTSRDPAFRFARAGYLLDEHDQKGRAWIPGAMSFPAQASPTMAETV